MLMTVTFLPDTDVNPYHTNLADALDSQNVDVHIGEAGGKLPLLRSTWRVKHISGLHFHWIAPYFIGSSLLRTAIKTLLTVVQLAILRVWRIPVVWTVHDVLSHNPTYPRYERLCKAIFVRLVCDHLIVHCEKTRRDLVNSYHMSEEAEKRISMVPHGHYIDNYPNEISRVEARSDLGLNQDDLVLLFFGHLRRYKDIPGLLNAFSEVNETSTLLIAGYPHDEEITELVQRKTQGNDNICHFIEKIPEERVQVFMNAADVVVLPFKRVTTSGSAVLAMSFGKAVIAPRLGCLPELLEESGSILYPPRSSEGLVEALTMADSAELDEMGTENYEKIKQYSWEIVADQTREIYEMVGIDFG